MFIYIGSECEEKKGKTHRKGQLRRRGDQEGEEHERGERTNAGRHIFTDLLAAQEADDAVGPLLEG